ncbi:MAG TPA: patatin-like phospholipase family protein [Bacteroidales bacterium]|jgi:NTE family protein|nr:patatin-like phospholipase family protein [Bacteroidales bacterium]
MKRKRTHQLGIAFGGGGAKGYYHLGVLKRLMEMGHIPEMVSGTSVGSIVAAYYGQGFTIEEMLQAFEHLTVKDFFGHRLSKEYLIDSQPIHKIFEETFRVHTFEELQVPVKIVTTCLETAKEVVFDSGPLADAVLASCSIPVLFPPVEIEGKHYVDGGVVRNVPVIPIRDYCKNVYAINLFPAPETDLAYNKSIRYIADRSISMLFRAGARADLQQADLVIEDKKMAKFNTFDLKYKDEMYELGYNTVF